VIIIIIIIIIIIAVSVQSMLLSLNKSDVQALACVPETVTPP